MRLANLLLVVGSVESAINQFRDFVVYLVLAWFCAMHTQSRMWLADGYYEL